MDKTLIISFIILFFLSFIAHGQINIDNSECSEIDEGTIYGCSWGGIRWAKTYELSDFGIDTTEEFIIDYGEIGLSHVGTWDVNIQFYIYEINSGFPGTFSEANLIGSSQVIPVPYFGQNDPQIISSNFDNDIIVPANVEMILVEVKQLSSSSSGAVAFAANTDYDGTLSWFMSDNGGCPPSQYTSTFDLGYSTANFHITVNGQVNNINQPFSLFIDNDCSDSFKQFDLTNHQDIASVLWDFGDPMSGSNNISNLNNPSHNFSSAGTYTITAIITSTSGNSYTLTKQITTEEPPLTFPLPDIHACDENHSGFSSLFDTSMIEDLVLGGQTNMTITYFDGNGNEYSGPFPDSMTNTIINNETITVRVSHSNRLCCYTETSFNLIVDPTPNINSIDPLYSCDQDQDGISSFNISNIQYQVTGGLPNLNVTYYDSNDNIIPQNVYSNYQNLIPSQDTIKVRATHNSSGCYDEIIVSLFVNSAPITNPLTTIVGCDDNNDGFSEYFDTTNIETLVLGNQSQMSVTYYNENGNLLPSPLPNPFTNSEPFHQNIIVRVTNNSTNCYSETILELATSGQPTINEPNNLFSCDLGNGIGSFNTSNIENQIIGNQTGLNISYYDENGNSLSSPLPSELQNTTSFLQTIYVKVEDNANPNCFSETSFDLIVNELPEIDLDNNYFICNLEPSIILSIDSGFDSYEWVFENEDIISNSYSAEIINEGSYTLFVSKNENNITCQNSFTFNLTRSNLPSIIDINYQELGSNFIEIIASGDGDFEYSIDGINYQDSNYFNNMAGGCYTVFVRDKDGCGEDSGEITILDHPKYFTPNNDGQNDFWQIEGIEKYPSSTISIFDRYGKLLKLLSPISNGWDGTYNGELMLSNDYWFKVILKNGKTFSGHFTLKR